LEIKDIANTVKMDGSASDIGLSIADGVIQTVAWPASLITMGGISVDSDYVNSLKSFEQYVINELGIPEENADQRVDVDETEKGIYYVDLKDKQTGEMKSVQYRFNSSLGTFVKSTTPSSNTNPKVNPNPNPNPTTGTLTTAAQVQSFVQSVPGYSGVTVSSFTFLGKSGDIETYKITDPNGASGTLNYNTTTRTATIS